MAEPHNNLAPSMPLPATTPRPGSSWKNRSASIPSYATAHENLGDVHAMLAADAYGRAQRLEAGNTGLPRKLELVRQLAGPQAGRFAASAPARHREDRYDTHQETLTWRPRCKDSFTAPCWPPWPPSRSPRRCRRCAQKVKLATSEGDIVVELDAAKAPKTVDNFLQYVKAGHYDGTVFHRVIDNFMIQGGGMTADLKEKPTRAPIAPREPQRPDATSAAPSRWRAPTIRTRRPRSSSSTSRTTTSSNQPQARDGNGYAVFGKVDLGHGRGRQDQGRAAPAAGTAPERAGRSR